MIPEKLNPLYLKELRKEAGDYIKNNHPDPECLFTGNKKFDEMLYQNILALMANFAHHKRNEPLSDEEKKHLSEWLVFRERAMMNCYIKPKEARELIRMLNE